MTNAQKKEQMYSRIGAHGETLLAIFPSATEKDPVKLCKKLRRYETRAQRLATDFCNGAINIEQWEQEAVKVKASVCQLLSLTEALAHETGFFINSDPRGYALKLSDVWTRGFNSTSETRLYTDWGGYGILCPDFS